MCDGTVFRVDVGEVFLIGESGAGGDFFYAEAALTEYPMSW